MNMLSLGHPTSLNVCIEEVSEALADTDTRQKYRADVAGEFLVHPDLDRTWVRVLQKGVHQRGCLQTQTNANKRK